MTAVCDLCSLMLIFFVWQTCSVSLPLENNFLSDIFMGIQTESRLELKKKKSIFILPLDGDRYSFLVCEAS